MKIFLLILFVIPLIAYSQKNVIENDGIKINKFYELSLGAYIPNGNASILGNHPTIGLKQGYDFTLFTMALAIDYRLLKSKNVYEFNYKDSIYQTDRFFGSFYLGLDLGKSLIQSDKFEIDWTMGFGVDEFEAVKAEKYWHRLFKTDGYVICFNYNIGFQFSINPNDFFSTGCFLKYNFVDYTRKNKTNLTGNYLNFGISVKLSELDTPPEDPKITLYSIKK